MTQSKYRIFLIIVGSSVLLITIFYSNYLANQLRLSEEKDKQIFKEAYDYLLNNPDLSGDATFYTDITTSFKLPFILENDLGQLIGENFSEEKNQDEAFLKSKVADYLKEGKIPLESNAGGYASKMYIFNSKLLDYITFFPIVQMLLVSLFIILGYYLLNSSRRAEQNRLWVGMAKETAHQLGTPISAIIAWIQHLRENTEVTEEHIMVLDELTKDVQRLELVAERFSKIGSSPELSEVDIVQELEEMNAYMKRRASKRVVFHNAASSGQIIAKVNKNLLNWVIENLMRNSLDSLDGEGSLMTNIQEEENNIVIQISDTGRGIAPQNFKTIFNPGFTTKKRGWGLGLSLAKRIIEDYHGGKIYVKESIPMEKTTFEIRLPK